MNNLMTALLISVFVSTSAFAQEKKGGVFLKVDFMKSEGAVQNVSHNADSVSVEIESNFAKDKLFLSGWALGYRKEDIHFVDAGHYFSLRTFHNFDLHFTNMQLGIGEEWGYPSLTSEKTISGIDANHPEAFSHVFLIRNSSVPALGADHDGTLYPFVTMTLSKKVGIFKLEGGLRMDIRKFGVDTYGPGGQFSLSDKWTVSPSVLVGFGLRMW